MAETASALQTVPPPPYHAAMTVVNGTPSKIWADWFRQMFIRVGQEIALNNVQLENIQQSDLSDVQAAITALQSLGISHTARISALEAAVDGLNQEPAT